MTVEEPTSMRRNIDQASNSRIFVAILFLGFVATGACTVLLGPLLPLLASKWHISDQAAGSLFTAQFLGSLVGTLASGFLIQKLGFGKTLGAGYVLMAAYVFAVWIAPWPWIVVIAAVNGLGLGLVIPSTNMAVSDHFAQGRASALNLINLSWSIGAIICPAALAIAIRVGHLQGLLNLLGILTVSVALIVAGNHARQSIADSATPHRLAGFRFAVLAALFFLYIGTEGAVAGWLATYAKRTVLSATLLWMTVPSFFWGAMMLGRSFAPFILRRTSERVVVSTGLAISFLGVIGILAGKSSSLLVLSAAVTGLGLCSVFPIFIAMVSHFFGEAATQASAYLFACAALGGAVLPWLVGVISSRTGHLQAGLLVALGGVALQLALVLVLGTGRASPSST